MIDLLLKEQKNRTKINDVRVKSQHEIDSDHYFIGAKLKGGTYIHIKKKKLLYLAGYTMYNMSHDVDL